MEAILTTWYERNREKAINDAKTWRLNNLDAYRAYQREYGKRKRAAKRVEKAEKRFQPVDLRPVAPEGYDPFLHGDLQQWCVNNGVPFDRDQW